MERIELWAKHPARDRVTTIAAFAGAPVPLLLMLYNFARPMELFIDPSNRMAMLAAHVLGTMLLMGLYIAALMPLALWARHRFAPLRIELSRHKLRWGEREVPLESIVSVGSDVLSVQLEDEQLAIPDALRVDATEAEALRAALERRIQVLRAADERSEARASLQALAADANR